MCWYVLCFSETDAAEERSDSSGLASQSMIVPIILKIVLKPNAYLLVNDLTNLSIKI